MAVDTYKLGNLAKQISSTSKENGFPLWVGNLAVLLTLILCEAIWYAPIIRRVGFYLDDWATYANFHVAQQNWPALLKVAMEDSRITTRPIEALVYVGSWFAFHDNPVGHHLLNCGFEIAAAFFLYLVLNRLSGSRPLSFIASLLMLIYPNHDATHYWVTANTISLALAMYLFSLWQSVKAVQDQKPICFLYATLAFLASLLTYEAFLPFAGITGACLLYAYKNTNSWLQACLKSAIALVPFAAGIGAVYYYQRVFLRQLGIGFHHTLKFSMSHTAEVLQAGLAQTIGWEAVTTYCDRIQETIVDLNVFKVATLVLLVAVVFLTLRVVADKENDFSHPYAFIGLGLLIVIGSYTIFGVSPEYMPRLESIWNRINIGASVGASMIFAGFLGILAGISKGDRKASCVLLAALTAPLITFFIMADWGWSMPWITSWIFQKYTVGLVKDNKEKFKNVNSVVLANCPRYVMWSPLFDGVWDFAAMLHMYSGNPAIQATVTSDRLRISNYTIKDISCNYLCGEYPFKKLVVFIPNPKQWIEINSAAAFIDTIEKRALRFGMTEKDISRWRRELVISEMKRN